MKMSTQFNSVCPRAVLLVFVVFWKFQAVKAEWTCRACENKYPWYTKSYKCCCYDDNTGGDSPCAVRALGGRKGDQKNTMCKECIAEPRIGGKICCKKCQGYVPGLGVMTRKKNGSARKETRQVAAPVKKPAPKPDSATPKRDGRDQPNRGSARSRKAPPAREPGTRPRYSSDPCIRPATQSSTFQVESRNGSFRVEQNPNGVFKLAAPSYKRVSTGHTVKPDSPKSKTVSAQPAGPAGKHSPKPVQKVITELCYKEGDRVESHWFQKSGGKQLVTLGVKPPVQKPPRINIPDPHKPSRKKRVDGVRVLYKFLSPANKKEGDTKL